MSFSEAKPLIALLIYSNSERAQVIEEGLSGSAITRLASCNKDDILSSIKTLAPDVVIMDCGCPDNNTIENLRLVAKENPKPIVMFVDEADDTLAKEAVRAGVSSYIVDGLTAERVRPVIEIAIERFKVFDGLLKELSKSKDNLEARKLIERAKGLLMDQRGLTEAEAFAAMRGLAMKESTTIRQVAENILSVFSLINDKPAHPLTV